MKALSKTLMVMALVGGGVTGYLLLSKNGTKNMKKMVTDISKTINSNN